MLKVLELFGGIGACSKALTNLGIEHEIVDLVEIDKYAVKSFNAVHGTNFEPQDITTWDKDIEVDLIMHGSPCQDFSVAGKQLGGEEGSGTRSSLMYETLRIVKNLRPKYVIWENVKGLLSAKHRANFDRYQSEMTALGYVNYWRVLNAKDYGVPQNRERVFTVSIMKPGSVPWAVLPYIALFKFPEPMELTKTLRDVLEEEVDEKYYISPDQVDKLLASNYDQNKRFYRPDGISPTLNTMGGGQRQPKIVASRGRYDENGKVYQNFESRKDGLTNTITSVQKDNYLRVECIKSYIRKLTPKECWRLMGFDDADFERAEKVNSNTQLYKQAGNSIVVNVLMAIFRELLNGSTN